MLISVVGCGYLRAVHSAAITVLGHAVIGVDVDQTKVGALSRGQAPFFEPGLPEILSTAHASGRLRFSTRIIEACDAIVHFIAVGTPQLAGVHAADLRLVDAAISSLVPYLKAGDVVRSRMA